MTVLEKNSIHMNDPFDKEGGKNIDTVEYRGMTEEREKDGRSLNSERTAFFSVSKVHLIEILPILLMIGVVPLVVRLQVYDAAEELRSSGINDITFDLYSYSKSMVILILDIVMLLFLIRFSREKRALLQDRETRMILGGVYLFSALAIVSTILSDYKTAAIWGIPERSEGILMILSYVGIIFYILYVLRDFLQVRRIVFAVLFLSMMMSALALVNRIFQKDVLFMFPLSYLTIPGDLRDFQITNDEHWNSLTLYNRNFVGSYCTLMIPMLFVISRKGFSSLRLRFFSFHLFLFALWMLFLSKSQAGMVGVILSAVIGSYYFAPDLLRPKKLSAGIAVLLIIGSLGVNRITGGEAGFYLKGIVADAVQMFSVDKDYVYDPTYGAYLYDVIIEGETAKIRSKAGDFKIIFGEDSADVVDMNGRSLRGEHEVEVKKSETREYILLEVPHDSVRIMEHYDKKNRLFSLLLEHDKLPKFILNRDQYGEVYLSTWNKIRQDMVIAPHLGFEGKEHIASGRGYIWSRTIPMLKDTILIGHGPDNYLMAFPQGDYLAKADFLPENPFVPIDKPHNMYLQWGVNEGVVATLALLFSLGYYLVSSLKLYRRKREYTLPELFGIGCMLSVIGYMGAGFFNDSVVSVAPIFWSFFGAGVAVNALVRRELVDRI